MNDKTDNDEKKIVNRNIVTPIQFDKNIPVAVNAPDIGPNTKWKLGEDGWLYRFIVIFALVIALVAVVGIIFLSYHDRPVTALASLPATIIGIFGGMFVERNSNNKE